MATVTEEIILCPICNHSLHIEHSTNTGKIEGQCRRCWTTFTSYAHDFSIAICALRSTVTTIRLYVWGG